MKRYALFIVALIFVNTLSFGQEKTFTIQDVVLNSYSKLAPENLNQLAWIPSSEAYSYVKGNKLFVVQAASGKENVAAELSAINEMLSKGKIKELKRFPRITWINSNEFRFWAGLNLVRFNVESGEMKILNSVPTGSSNRTTAPDNKTVAFTIDNNLYLSIGGKHQKITNDENPGIVNGQSVSRSEFGITGGIFFSPNTNFLAFYRKDETEVSEYPIVDVSETPAKLQNIRYPMNGQKSEYVQVGIYNIASGQTTWLADEGRNDNYLTCVTWSPDEKYIFVAWLNRDQNHMKLKKFNSKTGELVNILFEERDEQYVEPEENLIFLPNEPDKFLWHSERDGWKHLYLYDIDGNLIKQVTKGNWIVTGFQGFGKDGNSIYFMSTKESPIERHLYSVNLDNLKMSKITSGSGMHRVILNPGAGLFLDSYSNITTPRKIDLLNTDGKLLRNILISKNPTSDYALGEVKLFTIKNSDDIDLYCRMVLPVDFVESKKYPVIVYVYGGPHAQLVTNSWLSGRYGTWFQLMAQKGFIVFTVDNRGSDNRGLEFEQATFRRLGTVEIQDQLEGVKYLKSLSYVDPDRIGVFGWSYGGFMTTSLMTRTNGTYKVGVAGGAVIDWKYYEVMYGERYMDTEESNPEGFAEASLLNHVKDLKGKLLMVHGTSDPVVVWQNTLRFAQEATHLNIPLDYFPYVGHPHGVVGRDAVHLYSKLTQYFIDNL